MTKFWKKCVLNRIKPEKLRDLSFSRLLLGILLTQTALFYSCKKEPSSIGDGILPVRDRLALRYTDSTSISSYTIATPPFSKTNIERALLGSYDDPIFGENNTSDFITNFRLSTSGVVFADSTLQESMNSLGRELTTISFKLRLYVEAEFVSAETDSRLVGMQLSVYELLDLEEGFSSDYEPIYGDLLVEKTFNYETAPCETYVVETTGDTLYSTYKYLDIDLPISFGDKILRASNANLSSNDVFTDFIKGLYFKVDPLNSNAIFYIDLFNTDNSLRLNYTDTSDIYVKTYDFLINDYCIRSNLYKHNTPTELLDTTLSSFTYIQTMDGVLPIIDISGMKGWRDSGIVAITDASIYITFDTTNTEDYPPPSSLFLYPIASDGNLLTSINDLIVKETINPATVDHYKLNITNLFFDYIQGNTDYDRFFILPEGNMSTAKRAVFYNNHPTKGIKFGISYVKE